MERTLRDPHERVSPRAQTMWALEAALSGIVVVVALAVTALFWETFSWRWWVVLAVAVLATAYTVVMPPWRYRVHRWEITDTAVYTQEGWWSRERRIAPMSRIQTVDHTEGALQQLLGLATVTVTTASAAGALEIAGLERTVALRLSEELTRTAEQAGGDAT